MLGIYCFNKHRMLFHIRNQYFGAKISEEYSEQKEDFCNMNQKLSVFRKQLKYILCFLVVLCKMHFKGCGLCVDYISLHLHNLLFQLVVCEIIMKLWSGSLCRSGGVDFSVIQVSHKFQSAAYQNEISVCQCINTAQTTRLTQDLPYSWLIQSCWFKSWHLSQSLWSRLLSPSFADCN